MSIKLRLGCAALVLGLVSVAACGDDEEDGDGSGGSGATGASGSTSSSSSSASGSPTSSSSSSSSSSSGGGGEDAGGAGGVANGGAGGEALGGAGGQANGGAGGDSSGGAGGQSTGGAGQGGTGGGGNVVPPEWDCNPSWYNEVGQGETILDCDCSCGAPDPDCAVTFDNFYCSGSSFDTGVTCSATGVCSVPTDWTCDAALYDQEGNGVANPTCECGCGTSDPDCAPGDSFPVGGCGAGEVCWNDECEPAPAGWTCNPAYYDDGGCDCGCGIVDIDCANATVAECDYCANTGSCSSSSCPGTINPTNNATCL